jgi:hypothetical protein
MGQKQVGEMVVEAKKTRLALISGVKRLPGAAARWWKKELEGGMDVFGEPRSTAELKRARLRLVALSLPFVGAVLLEPAAVYGLSNSSAVALSAALMVGAAIGAGKLLEAAFLTMDPMGAEAVEALREARRSHGPTRAFCARAALSGRSPTAAECEALLADWRARECARMGRDLVDMARAHGGRAGGPEAAARLDAGSKGELGALAACWRASKRVAFGGAAWAGARSASDMAADRREGFAVGAMCALAGVASLWNVAPHSGAAVGDLAWFFVFAGLGFGRMVHAAVCRPDPIRAVDMAEAMRLAPWSSALRSCVLEADAVGRTLTQMEFNDVAKAARAQARSAANAGLRMESLEAAREVDAARPAIERGASVNEASRMLLAAGARGAGAAGADRAL